MTGAGRPEVPRELRPQLSALRDLAVDLAIGAGELVRAGRREAVSDRVGTKSSVTDVVTIMDRASEDYLRRRLDAERPGDAVLGEEAGIERSAAAQPQVNPITWVVDPIDGTVNYLYGRSWVTPLGRGRGVRSRGRSPTPRPARSTTPTTGAEPSCATTSGPATPPATDGWRARR